MKKKLFIFFMTFLAFVSFNRIQASSSQVFISIEASKVGNLYYEIIENGKRIEDDLIYTIYNSENKLVYTNSTKDGLLMEYDLDFDQYTIYIKDKAFPIQIDKDYLRTQHILKQLDISSPVFTQTNDQNNIALFYILNIVSFLFLIKRRAYE